MQRNQSNDNLGRNINLSVKVLVILTSICKSHTQNTFSLGSAFQHNHCISSPLQRHQFCISSSAALVAHTKNMLHSFPRSLSETPPLSGLFLLLGHSYHGKVTSSMAFLYPNYENNHSYSRNCHLDSVLTSKITTSHWWLLILYQLRFILKPWSSITLTETQIAR